MRRLLIAISTFALLPVAAASAAGAVSGTFTGKSSQGEHVSFKIVDGNIRSSSFAWSASCAQPGVSFSGSTAFGGRLTGNGYYVHDTRVGPVQGGYRAKRTETVRFTVTGQVLKGTFKLSAIVYGASGKEQTTCSTPRITYRARS
jgi:hypothetical protein